MIASPAERAAVSAALPINPTAYGADFRILQVLGPLTEWRTHGIRYVEFASKFLGFDVHVGYSIDDEEEYPDAVLLEVHFGRAELTLHLNQTALDAVDIELSDAVREQDARELIAAQERRAEDRQLELTL